MDTKRRQEVTLEFAELSRMVQQSSWRGGWFRLSALFKDSLPERKEHGSYRVTRQWNPTSFVETCEMIEWVLLTEKLFGRLPMQRLTDIFANNLKPRE